MPSLMNSSVALTAYERRFFQIALWAPAASLALAVIILFPAQGLALTAAISICWLVSSRFSDFVFFLLLGAAATVMVLLGAIRFTFFPQAAYLLRRNADPAGLILDFQLWGPRYLLSYPAVLLSRWLEIDLNLAFTIYGLFCMGILVMVIVRCCDGAVLSGRFPEQRYLCQFLVGTSWLLIACFMNGRLMLSFLGMALVLAGQIGAIQRAKLTVASVVLQAVGAFFTLMTTGTVMVAFAQMLGGSLLIGNFLSAQDRIQKTRSFLILTTFAILLLPFVYQGTAKNAEFFGGNVIGLLSHGAGSLFLLEPTITMSLLIVTVLIVAALVVVRHGWVRRNPALLPAWLAVPIALVGGLFGYSTMLMALPSLMILGVYGVLNFAGKMPRGSLSSSDLP